MLKTETDFFGKEEYKVIAGIAIIWMVWHHLFTYPFVVNPNIHYGSFLGEYADKLVWQTSRMGNICVYIFAFSSGYSVFKNWNKYTSFRSRITRLYRFLRILWLLCFVIWTIAFLGGYGIPTISEMILSLMGIGDAGGNPTIGFSWYAAYYIFFILSLPLLRNLLGGARYKIVWRL